MFTISLNQFITIFAANFFSPWIVLRHCMSNDIFPKIKEIQKMVITIESFNKFKGLLFKSYSTCEVCWSSQGIGNGAIWKWKSNYILTLKFISGECWEIALAIVLWANPSSLQIVMDFLWVKILLLHSRTVIFKAFRGKNHFWISAH